jgi:GNAT superfamily N-acetyltransferase
MKPGFVNKSAHYVGDYSGAALWLPPDVHPDVDQLISLLQRTGSDEAKKDGPEIFEKMSGYHPNEPHWYLPLLGVDPIHHGQGLGSALLQHVLVMCDQDNKYAYLESSNPRNRRYRLQPSLATAIIYRNIKLGVIVRQIM